MTKNPRRIQYAAPAGGKVVPRLAPPLCVEDPVRVRSDGAVLVEGYLVGAMTRHSAAVLVISIYKLFQPCWAIIQIVVRRADECVWKRIERGKNLLVRSLIFDPQDIQAPGLKTKNITRQQLEIVMSDPKDRSVGLHRLPKKAAQSEGKSRKARRVRGERDNQRGRQVVRALPGHQGKTDAKAGPAETAFALDAKQDVTPYTEENGRNLLNSATHSGIIERKNSQFPKKCVLLVRINPKASSARK